MNDEGMQEQQELSFAEKKAMEKQRNIQNNANNVKVAADVAANSANPYAKAAGMAVKAADKLSGGKASEQLGKKLNTALKLSPGGRLAQKGLNKLSESGASDRIGAAVNAKNNGKASLPKNGSVKKDGLSSAPTNKKEAKEQSSDGGSASAEVSSKVIKIGLIFCVAAFPLVIFICLLTSASSIYIKSIGLGNADSVSSEDAEEKIGKTDDDDMKEGVTEDDVSFDIFISDDETIRNVKLESANLVKVAKTTYLRRKYNEADLGELEDFYPGLKKTSKNRNEAYDFYYKMYLLYTTYRDDYNVMLDLPLLMSTLMIQYDDIKDVFGANLSDADKTATPRKKPIAEFDYFYDWEGHILSSKSSVNDMEILAQRMVSYQVKESCIDSTNQVVNEKILRDNETKNQVLVCSEGETYKREELGMQVDKQKYKEFLKEYIEKKYYLDEKVGLSANPVDGLSISKSDFSLTGDSPFVSEMLSLANSEYKITNGAKGGMKYINAFGGFGAGTPWCAIFVSYLTANTKYNNQTLYPDIIPFRTASSGQYIRYFDSSERENLNFYYNDSCKNLKGKNGSVSYVPKKGDFIFFDWGAGYYDISSNTQDHIGIVEKYENGYIYTIEGNSGNTIAKLKYSINDCRVIGFGSWY